VIEGILPSQRRTSAAEAALQTMGYGTAEAVPLSTTVSSQTSELAFGRAVTPAAWRFYGTRERVPFRGSFGVALCQRANALASVDENLHKQDCYSELVWGAEG
jgi:hypothetical protein